MKQKLLKLIALCLVLVSLVPYVSAAEPGVNLFADGDIDLNNVVINVGDTVSIGCDANEWWRSNPNSNYIRITMSGGGAISIKGSDRGSGSAVATVTGVKAGQSILSFYIEACLKTYNHEDFVNPEPDNGDEDTPENNYYYNDYTDPAPEEEILVLWTTSVSVPITVIGEEEPEIELPLPEVEIVDVDAGGKIYTGKTAAMEEGEIRRFACYLSSGHIENPYNYYINIDGVRWSLDAKSDEYTMNRYGDFGVEVLCLKGNTKGTLIAYITVAIMSGPDVIETQTIKSHVNLQSEETDLVAGELFEKVDVDKVPNPFVNLSKDAWYYDSFMSAYAWGLLDGIDFSEKQDGSMILSMKKTVFDGSEENVAANFVPENEWSAKKLSAANMGAVLHTLGSSPASISLLANNKSGAFVPQGSGNRACLVQEVYNVEKGIKGSISSYTKCPFTDISSKSPYYQAILWGADKGVVKGYGGGIFGPARGITRQEFCTILYRYAQKNGIALPATKKAKTFTDGGSIGNWAKDAVDACQRAGIINGYTDGSFKPNNSILFVEAVKMVSKFCHK